MGDIIFLVTMGILLAFIAGAGIGSGETGGSVHREPPYSHNSGARQLEPPPFPPDEVTFRFRSGVGPRERQRILRRIRGRILRSTRNGDYVIVRMEGEISLTRALSILEEESAVLFAEPRYLCGFQYSSPLNNKDLNDPLLEEQWTIENRGGRPCYVQGVDIHLPEAWEITGGSRDVIIVVIDSGVDLDHPDLEGQLYPQGEDDWNFSADHSRIPEDSTGHGTAVAGLAVATAGNGIGIAGVAPGCRLIPLKIDSITDMVINFVDAMDYLVSFAAEHPELRLVVNGSIQLIDSLAVKDAISRGHRAGIVLCFSAGNFDGPLNFPAVYPEVIAVGAIGPDGIRQREKSCLGEAWSSAHGPELDLVAPGVQLATTDKVGPGGLVSGDYNPGFDGTSGSSPIVAAVAALVLSANPALDPDRVQEILQTTAVDGGGDPEEDTPGHDEFMGWGRIDAGRAVALAADEAMASMGDVNCNNSVDLEDVLVILGYLFTGERRPSCFSTRADVNGDGAFDVSDPIYLARFLFQGGPPPRD